MAERRRRMLVAGGVLCLLIVISVVAARWLTGERTNVRYRPARRSPLTAASWKTDNIEFQIDGPGLLVNPASGPVTLDLPEPLRDAASSRVVLSRDGQLLSLINERGMAVWDGNPPHRQRHVWPAAGEPLAGDATGGVRTNGSRRYDLHELTIAFTIGPAGRYVCVHPAGENSRKIGDSNDGVALVRDVATGNEIQRLVHSGWGRVVDRVVWSPDGKRLATYSSYHRTGRYVIRVWEIDSARQLAEIEGIFDRFLFSEDGAQLYVQTERHPQQLAVYQLEGSGSGEQLASRRIDGMRSFSLSPDGAWIAAVCAAQSRWGGRGDSVLLLDASTLAQRWESHCTGAIQRTAFRSDSGELAAAWFVPNEMFGSSAEVKAWDTADGTVVLADSGLPLSGGLYYREDGAIQAGEYAFEPDRSGTAVAPGSR